MAKRTRRTDPHRPGVIVPSQYRYVLSYNCATSDGGWPVPSFGINCALDRRVELKDAETGKITYINGEHDDDGECCQCGLLGAGKKVISGPGKCAVCGAGFVYGDIWQHVPTGEYIHLGHDCATKYDMLADRSDWEAADAATRRRIQADITRAANDRRMVEFCETQPGLLDALNVEHEIVADIKRKLREYGSISTGQIALVRKIAHEVLHPEDAPPPEVKIQAPAGKVTFRGTVVSRKNQETNYGITTRITVKVTTPEGVWLAWGTAPAALLDATYNHGGLKGCEVEITATLQPGNEPHFAIMKRPRGKALTRNCDHSGEPCSGCQRDSQEWCPVQLAPWQIEELRVRHEEALRLQAQLREQGVLPRAAAS